VQPPALPPAGVCALNKFRRALKHVSLGESTRRWHFFAEIDWPFLIVNVDSLKSMAGCQFIRNID